MNKQGPGKIDWTDYSWSPVTGCYHACWYCYARKIAERFSTDLVAFNDFYSPAYTQGKPIYETMSQHGAFPFSFAPTFYPARLSEPAKVRKPSKIFVVSAGDLFGDWVPGEWVAQVMDVVRANPRHTFQFLTKNPKALAWLNPWPANAWVGVSVTRWSDMERALAWLTNVEAPVRFVSAEPLMGPLFGMAEDLDWGAIQWLILGAMTGPGAEDEEPPVWWGEQAVEAARARGIAVWVKDSLPWYENVSKRPKERPQS